jgi:hypothetical protein
MTRAMWHHLVRLIVGLALRSPGGSAISPRPPHGDAGTTTSYHHFAVSHSLRRADVHHAQRRGRNLRSSDRHALVARKPFSHLCRACDLAIFPDRSRAANCARQIGSPESLLWQKLSGGSKCTRRTFARRFDLTSARVIIASSQSDHLDRRDHLVPHGG